MLSMTRANLNKHLLAFERRNNVPPTLRQKRLLTRIAWTYAHGSIAGIYDTKTWLWLLDSSLSHIAKLCERLPVSE